MNFGFITYGLGREDMRVEREKSWNDRELKRETRWWGKRNGKTQKIKKKKKIKEVLLETGAVLVFE